MRVHPFFMPIIIIVALFGTVFTAQALGQWSTSGKTSVDLTKLTPADIKGWMTIQQVIDGLHVPPEWVYEAGNIPADVPPTTAMKDLEKLVPGFETSAMRDALTAKLSGASSTELVATPTPMATPKPTGIAGATATAKAVTGETHATPTPIPAGQAMPADQIKGKHTLKEVSQLCAVPLDKILAGLKLDPKTDPNTAIKDLISAGKISDATDVQKVVADLQKK